MNMKLDCYLKPLGFIDVSDTKRKISTLDWNSVKIKNNKAGVEDNLDFVLMYSSPDKSNMLLQNLFYNNELLKLFKVEIQQVQDIIDGQYEELEPKRIFINRLFPHKQIAAHIDSFYHHENTKRIHLPIITNDESFFVFSGSKLKMEAGEVTEFNNNVIHSAVNDSDLERVHMILDFGRKGDPYYGKANNGWNHYTGEE